MPRRMRRVRVPAATRLPHPGEKKSLAKGPRPAHHEISIPSYRISGPAIRRSRKSDTRSAAELSAPTLSDQVGPGDSDWFGVLVEKHSTFSNGLGTMRGDNESKQCNTARFLLRSDGYQRLLSRRLHA